MKTAEIPADTFTAAHTAIKTDKTYENKRIITFFIITVVIEGTFMLSNCYTNTPVCFHTINTGEKSQTWFTNQIVVCDDTTCTLLKLCDNYLHFDFSTANFNRRKLTDTLYLKFPSVFNNLILPVKTGVVVCSSQILPVLLIKHFSCVLPTVTKQYWNGCQVKSVNHTAETDKDWRVKHVSGNKGSTQRPIILAPLHSLHEHLQGIARSKCCHTLKQQFLNSH